MLLILKHRFSAYFSSVPIARLFMHDNCPFFHKLASTIPMGAHMLWETVDKYPQLKH